VEQYVQKITGDRLMFIRLHEWYYHGSGCGYQTKPVAINTEEISNFNETFDPYHNQDGTTITLKKWEKPSTFIFSATVQPRVTQQ
jgi:hypothetical protein